MTLTLYPHTPDWVSSPGDTLEEVMKYKETTCDRLSELTGISSESLHGILEGVLAVTEEYAALLEKALGVSREFWLDSEADYRSKLAAGCKKITR
jgi:HTH-type transcriptional regulator/antitoxin HigA